MDRRAACLPQPALQSPHNPRTGSLGAGHAPALRFARVSVNSRFASWLQKIHGGVEEA